jgi:hypothetical protein
MQGGYASRQARLSYGYAMSENQRAFEQALHESTVIADRIREAIADAPPKLVMLALSDLLQEHLTRLVMVEPDREQTTAPKAPARAHRLGKAPAE